MSDQMTVFPVPVPEGVKTEGIRELANVFLPPDRYRLVPSEETPEAADPEAFKRRIYRLLSEETGLTPRWGVLTGIRPVKLTGELLKSAGSPEAVREILQTRYLVHPGKADQLLRIRALQEEVFAGAAAADPEKNVGVYVGIPFCPSRCLYCSFPSVQKEGPVREQYLDALFAEIDACRAGMSRQEWNAETLYVGGGTPTSLSADQLGRLLPRLREAFGGETLREWTVEAGRPDTLTREKLEVLAENGAGRISVNPQTMKEETLRRIGRNHTPEQIEEAVKMAGEAGFEAVNADLIAGLPGEEAEDFEASLARVIALGPENITVHTLAVKRASRLMEADPGFHYRQAETVREMMARSESMLEAAGYRPYYLYRQKQMAGALENVGYSLPGKECLYNMRIMEEDQTILALGAGGISKRFYPAENRIQRVPNVSNHEIYIQRIDEMIKRKENGLFQDGF